MMRLIIGDIAAPILRRLGTGLGAFLGGAGVAATDVETIVIGTTVAAGVLIDLMVSQNWRKRKGVK